MKWCGEKGKFEGCEFYKLSVFMSQGGYILQKNREMCFFSQGGKNKNS